MREISLADLRLLLVASCPSTITLAILADEVIDWSIRDAPQEAYVGGHENLPTGGQQILPGDERPEWRIRGAAQLWITRITGVSGHAPVLAGLSGMGIR